MDSEADPIHESDDIPAQLPLNYALSAKDALAIGSLLALFAALTATTVYGVGACFGIASSIPIRNQLQGTQLWLVMGTYIVANVAAVLVGKYLWLIAMCRTLSRVNVGWLVAYGRPRRISGFDQVLIRRLYRVKGPAMETRLRPLPPIGYLCWLHGAVYAAGAILSAGLGLLPLMRGDPRPWQLAAFLMALALLHIPLARWAGRKKP